MVIDAYVHITKEGFFKYEDEILAASVELLIELQNPAQSGH